MQNWISRDVAALLKEAADPITYGRLLRVSKVFGDSKNVNLRRKRRKLKELLDELPAGSKPKKPRTAYIFFTVHRSKELKEELPDVKFSEIGRQCGQEWRRMKGRVETTPYIAMAEKDKVRFQRECDPDEWAKLVRRRTLTRQALAAIGDEETILLTANDVIMAKRTQASREVWRNVGGNWPGRAAFDRVRNEVYRRHKVPKPGRSAYNFFMKEVNGEVRRDLVKMPGEFASQFNARVMREIGMRWKTLTPEQRRVYDDMAHQDKLERARQTLAE